MTFQCQRKIESLTAFRYLGDNVTELKKFLAGTEAAVTRYIGPGNVEISITGIGKRIVNPMYIFVKDGRGQVCVMSHRDFYDRYETTPT